MLSFSAVCTVHPVTLESCQNSCFCCRGVQTLSHPAIALRWWWAKKRVASVHAACWKPKLRCGTRPQTKIRNVHQSSHAPDSDNGLFTWQHGLSFSSFLHCLNRTNVCLPIGAFPLWKDSACSHKSCFVIYNPWIVLVAIYTMHSEKQETFWLQWT